MNKHNPIKSNVVELAEFFGVDVLDLLEGGGIMMINKILISNRLSKKDIERLRFNKYLKIKIYVL